MSNDTGINVIFDLVYKIFKLDCQSYNKSYMERRVNARIMAHNLAPDNYDSYAKLLETNLEEQRRLYDALTINVTQFFRDIKLWDTLKKNVIPKLIEEKRNKSEKILSIWSCGCSSGEEPYSLAILLKEALKDRRDILPVIYATDIDSLSLTKAKNAVYDISVFKSIPQEYFIKYFKQVIVKEKVAYELDPSIKSLVSFRTHNFLDDPPPAKIMDVIICRNVIIYFTQEAKDKLMSLFYENLTDHGWLVLGKSEVIFTIKMQRHFYLYNVEERVYRKERRKEQVKIEVEKRINWWPGYIK
ncbi:MAG: protein-glutamate O-methyltransferase CheR [Candidatus Omnitrophota bacterium]